MPSLDDADIAHATTTTAMSDQQDRHLRLARPPPAGGDGIHTIDTKSTITQTVATTIATAGGGSNTVMNKGTADENATAGSDTLQTQRPAHHKKATPSSSIVPAPSLEAALKDWISHNSCKSLEKGIPVMKVTTYGQLKRRVITVTKDKCALLITHEAVAKGTGVEHSSDASKLKVPLLSRKGGLRLFGGAVKGDAGTSGENAGAFLRYLDIADIDSISVGYVGTRKLESARESNRLKGADSLVDREARQIVSIFHHGNQTVDFLVLNDSHRQELVLCLESMMSVYKDHMSGGQQKIGNDALLMRYIWYDVDVNRDGKICEREFGKILGLINLYIKNPRKAYRQFRKDVLGRTGGALSCTETVSLLHYLKDATAKSDNNSSSAASATTATAANKKKKGTKGNSSDNNKKSMPNQIWDQVFGPNTESMDATRFMTLFCHAIQGETMTASLQDVKDTFRSLNGMELNHLHHRQDQQQADVGGGGEGKITRSRFEAYLFRENNSAYDPKLLAKRELKNEPISKYWINTSHNTYLTGDQLTSASSVEMYLRSLRRGCKCLELDCWDGEKTDQGPLPVVYHGYTATSKILFHDIIRVVKAYLEENPLTYPVILSLENHCSPPFQRTLAFILEELLGDRLYMPLPEDRRTELPTPEALRGKVVIKGKRPPENDEDDNNGNDDDGSKEASNDGAASADTNPSEGNTTSTHHAKTVPELARLTLFHGTKFKSFFTSITEPVSHMHSINETKIKKVLKSSEAAASMWRLYNLDHMTRTYPAGTRVDSSNYNPVLAWSLGCQLVALNFQGNDSPLFLNDGKFREQDNCGYLRRPDGSLGNISDNPTSPTAGKKSKEKPVAQHQEDDEEEADPDILENVMDGIEEAACGDDATKNLIEKQKIAARLKKSQAALDKQKEEDSSHDQIGRLRIRVLSGSCLPKPKGAKKGEIIDPYVTVTVHDVVRGPDGFIKSASKSLSTNIVNNNGFCPVWNQPDDTQFVVSSPHVAIVEFDLLDQDLGFDDKIATAAIPVSCLRKGYRSVQLYDPNNTRTGPFGFANLLVEVQIFNGLE